MPRNGRASKSNSRPWSGIRLTESSPSITDLDPRELAKARRALSWKLLKPVALGPVRQRRSAEGLKPCLKIKISDRHKRVDVTGRARCHFGSEGFHTGAPNDDLANHLYIADDPHFRAFGIEEEDNEENMLIDEIDGVLFDNTYDDEDEADTSPALTATDKRTVVYSTDSPAHQQNLKDLRAK